VIGTQEGWLKGKSKSGEGWFPESYVEPFVAIDTHQHKQAVGVEFESSHNGGQTSQDTSEYSQPSELYSNFSEYVH